MTQEEITIFDDGSFESRVLQYELKQTYKVNVVQVKPDLKLASWLAEVIDETDEIQKIFLHFPAEDYITTGIRDEVNQANHLYPKLRVIPWYEKTSRDSLIRRGASYRIPLESPKEEPKFKAVKQTEVASDILQARPPRKEGISDEFVDKLKETKTIAVGKVFRLPEPVKEPPQDPFKELADTFKGKRRRKDAKHE